MNHNSYNNIISEVITSEHTIELLLKDIGFNLGQKHREIFTSAERVDT